MVNFQTNPSFKLYKKALKFILNLIATAIVIVAGVMVGVFLARESEMGLRQVGTLDAFPPLGGFMLLLLGSILAIHLVILIHELGHVVGGLAVGDSFGFLIVGFLKVAAKDGRLGFSLNKDLSLYGGVAYSHPGNAKYSPVNRAVMVGSGPLASLLTGVLFWLISYWVPHYLDPLSELLRITSAFSLFVVVGTMIPYKSGGFMSDGMQLFHLLLRRRSGLGYAAILTINSLFRHGTRPREIDPHFYQPMHALPPASPLGVGGNLYLYYYYLDQGHFKLAQEALKRVERNIKSYPKAFRRDLQAEIGFFYAFSGENISKSREMWSDLVSFLEEDKELIYYRFRGAIALAECHYGEAERWLRAGLAKVHSSDEPGLAALEIDLMNQMVERALDLYDKKNVLHE